MRENYVSYIVANVPKPPLLFALRSWLGWPAPVYTFMIFLDASPPIVLLVDSELFPTTSLAALVTSDCGCCIPASFSRDPILLFPQFGHSIPLLDHIVYPHRVVLGHSSSSSFFLLAAQGNP